MVSANVVTDDPALVASDTALDGLDPTPDVASFDFDVTLVPDLDFADVFDLLGCGFVIGTLTQHNVGMYMQREYG